MGSGTDADSGTEPNLTWGGSRSVAFITYDELKDALASVGDDPGGCPFEPLHQEDPDHHGKEFADAIWEQVSSDREELAALVRRIVK